MKEFQNLDHFKYYKKSEKTMMDNVKPINKDKDIKKTLPRTYKNIDICNKGKRDKSKECIKYKLKLHNELNAKFRSRGKKERESTAIYT